MSDATMDLRRGWYEPIHEAHQSETDLKLQEELVLLAASEMGVPGEMLVQIQHQAQELWLKCLALEAANLVEALDGDALFDALETLDRIVPCARCLSDQTRTLLTLAPSRLRCILRNLGPATGIESPGYQRLLAAAEEAWEALERLLVRRGVSRREIYFDRGSDLHSDLHRLLDRFVDWDGAMQAWMVEQIVLHQRMSDAEDTPAEMDVFAALAQRARIPLFPALWKIRGAKCG